MLTRAEIDRTASLPNARPTEGRGRTLRQSRLILVLISTYSVAFVQAGASPARSKTGMVISASDIASRVGARALKDGGNAADAAVATAFALAVTHPIAGNIGGGFLLYRSASGEIGASSQAAISSRRKLDVAGPRHVLHSIRP